MELVLILILVAVCLCAVLIGFIRGDGLLWYPFLFALVVIGWAVPQILVIVESGIAPGNSASKMIMMIILSFIFGWIGYCYRTNSLIRSANYDKEIHYNKSGLNFIIIGLSLFGAYFFYKVSQIAPEITDIYGGQWTGIITIYSFFASSLSCALAISLASMTKKVSLIPLLTSLFCLSFILHRIVFAGRREDAIQLIIFFALFIYLKYKFMIPRALQIIFVLAGTLFVTSIGDYRSVMLNTSGGLNWTGAGLRDILNIDFASNFTQSGKAVTSLELFNATLAIEGAEQALSFDFGLSLWNSFIHAYFPGQLIGTDIKNKLLFEFYNTNQIFNFTAHTGTTSTGFSDAFRSFWYLGSLIFFMIGRILRYWMFRAQNGDTLAIVTIMLLLPEALLAVTHNTHTFFLAFVFLFIFVIAPLRVISMRPPRRHLGA